MVIWKMSSARDVCVFGRAVTPGMRTQVRIPEPGCLCFASEKQRVTSSAEGAGLRKHDPAPKQWLLPCALMLGLALSTDIRSADLGSMRGQSTHSTVVQPLPSDEEEVEASIAFYAERVKRDPGDFNAQNRLADYHLQRLRDTNNAADLEAATRAARVSLATVPAERNLSGLIAMAQAEQFAHDFSGALELGRRLVKLVPNKNYSYEVLGDALLELGEYESADAAIRNMLRYGGVTVDTETRQARLAFLRGNAGLALHHCANAIGLALQLSPPPRQPVAWCHWQMGDVAFSTGDYAGAQQHNRDALTVFPDYYRALAGMAKALAARGDTAGAVEYYRRAIERFPDPAFAAALGDLYQLQGRANEAAAQYQFVRAIARLNQANGQRYNRQLALFDADHDREALEGYANAAREYAVRRDIYGADALAWAALKAGKLAEAQTAIKQALRLGTHDATLYYHAGMVARAAGDMDASRAYLAHAVDLNPRFDPLQAPRARRALVELSGDE
jgi:tetratricopeptide (TPR) repeat protein